MAPNVLKSILRWRLVEGNVHIDIKTKFGYKQYRLNIVEEKKSMMTKKWTPPERESIADPSSLVYNKMAIKLLIKEHACRYSLTAV